MNQAIVRLYDDIIDAYASVVEANLGLVRLSRYWAEQRPIDAPNDVGVLFGRGNPNHENSRYQYRRTFIDLIADSRDEGRHIIHLRRMAMVFVFSAWETRHRPSLIDVSGRADVRADAFGDLRHLRNFLLHSQGVLDRRLETLTMFPVGQEISPSKDDFDDTFRALIDAINQISEECFNERTNLSFDRR